MEKKKLSQLRLNKKVISKLDSSGITGGTGGHSQNHLPTCQSPCPGTGTFPDTGNLSGNQVCNATQANTCTVRSKNMSDCALTECLSTGGACA